MVLSDGELNEAMERGELRISPPPGFELLVKPSSVDLRLDPFIQIIRRELRKV